MTQLRQRDRFPGISTAFSAQELRWRKYRKLVATYDKAWRALLREDPAWAEWYIAHSDELAGGPGGTYAEFGDMEAFKLKTRNSETKAYVPAAALFEGKLKANLQDFFRTFYLHRAEVLGLPAPPP
ncbi:hypothetical protein GHK92_12760 [Nocardioides sp. dk4132]|uniref:hypothetical protein n=1 Tax=unclassified Nocardioides TaxID=2615069 RepID=UPI0012952B3C|nr:MULTISPECIES: hypothetical protein [unclassified Nocardioides]MQW76747.1 hypothetical protein [Nocardioides sp. dk4132]QGA06896.1 hypothetical protein GFH29_05460 [Nocardioides sp. dk884]